VNKAHLTPFNSYWDEECLKSAKELKKPSFCKAVIRCYWKSYSLLGIFTFIEVIYTLQADSSAI
jgi:hypothetical protein